MDVGRERIQRDAELMLKPHAPGCKCDLCAMTKLREWILKLARYCLALLGDLERAENLARAARRALMNPDNPEWPAKLHEALEAWERK